MISFSIEIHPSCSLDIKIVQYLVTLELNDNEDVFTPIGATTVTIFSQFWVVTTNSHVKNYLFIMLCHHLFALKRFLSSPSFFPLIQIGIISMLVYALQSKQALVFVTFVMHKSVHIRLCLCVTRIDSKSNSLLIVRGSL